ncbi:MAG TPA: TlpA disulfide reductase family protein [Candidatus Limnocylindria bacterium]|jgi:cytochrome c biogenesis protein CcmG/thiol:disulfide interchange protein DsbE|nr:TlpA disulfide reductase family protein [Candidatus Limnocylindria bacterium]
MKRALEWGIPLTIAVLFGWLILPRGPQFARLPVGSTTLGPWVYTNLQGQAIRSSDFTNQVVLINYWATFCPPCKAEIPAFNAIYEKYHSRGLEIIGIATDPEGAELVAPFSKRYEIKYPVVLYDAPPLPPIGGGIPLPTTLITDRNGKVVARYVGALSEEELEKALAPLLAAEAKP